jgi:hypothetical protein
MDNFRKFTRRLLHLEFSGQMKCWPTRSHDEKTHILLQGELRPVREHAHASTRKLTACGGRIAASQSGRVRGRGNSRSAGGRIAVGKRGRAHISGQENSHSVAGRIVTCQRVRARNSGRENSRPIGGRIATGQRAHARIQWTRKLTSCCRENRDRSERARTHQWMRKLTACCRENHDRSDIVRTHQWKRNSLPVGGRIATGQRARGCIGG